MGTRVPVQHYGIRSSNSYIGSLDDDRNTVNSRNGVVDRDAVHDSRFDHDERSDDVDCIHESYRNTLPLHTVGREENRSSLIRSTTGPYDMLTADDIIPIEAARTRFLQIIVDHFIDEHVVEVTDLEANYGAQPEHDKLSKRKLREIRCEGDPRFVLPLMYVANMYETLANDVNIRLSSLNSMREKTIAAALEAAGGLYRKLAKKFPRKGPYSFKRRELATSLETRTRFPELIQEEKRVRFVVVNGLDIIEKPNSMPFDDAEWFKRLTGRSEVAVSPQDYKFYSPRHKFRRVTSNSVSSIPGFPTFPVMDNSVITDAREFRSINEQDQQQTLSKHHMEPEYDRIQQSHHQTLHQNQHPTHFAQNHQCVSPSQLPEVSQPHHSPNMTQTQHMSCLQSVTGGGRMHLMTNPAKFCDECGAPYLRYTSKYCSECGIKRFGA